MNKSEKVVEILVNIGLLPKAGNFIITEELIDEYQRVYNSIYQKIGTPLKAGNRNYARKLAGIFLLKENQKRTGLTKEIKVKNTSYKENCGILYIISNKSFPNCYKVGITKNLDKRLQSYQTYDPYRAYKVEHYRFVEDSKKLEKEILDEFKFNIIKGEWIMGDAILKHFVDKIKNI